MKAIFVPSGENTGRKAWLFSSVKVSSGAQIEVRHDDLRQNAPEPGVGDAPAIGRPVRVDVQLARSGRDRTVFAPS
jgi:hypothetical protein